MKNNLLTIIVAQKIKEKSIKKKLSLLNVYSNREKREVKNG